MAQSKVAVQKEAITRSQFLGFALAAGLAATAVLLPNLATSESHQETISSHGYSFFDVYKYGADFDHLDYVNPDAPKGGEIAIWAPGTFDSFNPYARKGRSAALASAAFESLLTSTSDDLTASYGLLAHTVEYPEDKSWVIFHMRPEARFSDGSPVTAHDVVFSHNLFLEQGLPSYREIATTIVESAEALDDLRVKFTFVEGSPVRSRIGLVGGGTVMSKAWFEETGARLDESRLDPAIGSGPYVLDSYDINRRIVYRYNDDYWGADLPINIGRNNFESIRVEYFADGNAAFEGFKAGAYTFRQENSSRTWATQYDFPALENGSVVRDTLPRGSLPLATGPVFNLAKPQLQDRRVREAISLGFNFTWTNQTLQYGLFAQRESFWQNSENQAQGLPEGLELEVLNSVRDLVDPEIFTEEVTVPHTSSERQQDRRNMRRASQLLDEAGWIAGDDGLRRKDGQLLTLEFIEQSPNFDRILLPFIENLKAMGIAAEYTRIDPAQYTNRRRDRDYDMIYLYYQMADLPSTGLLQQFGSDQAAESVFNPAGYSSPAVDKIIDHVAQATEIDQVRAGAKALDRIMRRELFIIPVWYNDTYWVSYFDMFEHPENLPPYALGQLDFWWYNAEKGDALKASGAL